VQALAGTHPDIEEIAKPADKSFLPLELLIGDKEHRMQEGLCHRLGLRPFMGGRKNAIIDDADYLNPEGANCLLKTLEEPPPRSVLILIGTSPARQLPTIRSRCQLVRFGALGPEVVEELLVSRGLVQDAAFARQVARHSEGSLQRALELAEPALWAFRSELYRHLAEPCLASLELSRSVSAFVDEAGREAGPRRARLRRVIGLSAEFYRRLLIPREMEPEGDDELAGWIRRAREAGQPDSARIAARLDRCLEAAEQVDRNANQTTLIECWLDDLGRGDTLR